MNIYYWPSIHLRIIKLECSIVLTKKIFSFKQIRIYCLNQEGEGVQGIVRKGNYLENMKNLAF